MYQNCDVHFCEDWFKAGATEVNAFTAALVLTKPLPTLAIGESNSHVQSEKWGDGRRGASQFVDTSVHTVVSPYLGTLTVDVRD